MTSKIIRAIDLVRGRIKSIAGYLLGWIAVAGLRLLRLTDRKRLSDLTGWLMRKVGPWRHEQQVGRANLAAAFPEKAPAEIDQILTGVWDNLGRVAVEFGHLDRLRICDTSGFGSADVVYDDVTKSRFEEVRSGNRPTVVFAAHLANWEIPALCAGHFGLEFCVLFRPPNIRPVADAVLKIRAGFMGVLVPSSFVAPMQLANALESGKHVGMLVDQHDRRGSDVLFFGRRCKANPLLAQLARHLNCPIRGARVIRQHDRHSFRVELSEPLNAPRDAAGLIDIPDTMQAITSMVETWVREYPDQWLWLHRRWR
jgi:Kdo2-lipid IVA lauroyltransferase/acyltransferase